MSIFAQKLDPKMRETRVPFMHLFSDACERFGCKMLPRTFITNRIQKEWRKLLKPLLLRKKKKQDYLIVPCNGDDILESIYPYYDYNIIPMLWDVWPYTWKKLYNDLNIIKPPLVFVTVRQMAEKIQKDLGIPAYWIPEGFAPNVCSIGPVLTDREIEVYELGRYHSGYHSHILNLVSEKRIKTYKADLKSETGEIIKKAYQSSEEFYKGLSQTKIVICFPQNITNPERAGNLETLTQRYWEAMLSRSLIVGRAPAELIDFVGYNPVIEVDWKNPEKQLESILYSIESYQELVDKNYTAASNSAYWDNRLKMIGEYLSMHNIRSASKKSRE